MSSSVVPQNVKVPTGVPGLDEILAGGLPPRRLYLIQGAPGSGKTTLALQFLLTGAIAGERVLYISLSETREEVEEVRPVSRVAPRSGRDRGALRDRSTTCRAIAEHTVSQL